MDMFLKFLVAAVMSGTPLIFGTLGEIITQKAGNLNLGVEGTMAMGAFAAFYVGYTTDSVILAVLGAFIAGALCSLLYTFLTVTMRANQNVTGLTLTIFGVGLANFLGEYVRTRSGGDTLKLSERFTTSLYAVDIPGLTDIPVIGPLLFNYTPFVYLGIGLCLVMGIYLKYTRAGLNLRAVGEDPAVADAAGINVNRVKYVNIMMGGGICALGGAHIALVLCGGVWVQDLIGGLGWISVALVIFSGWNPFLCILGASVFGGFQILKFYMPAVSLPDAFYSMLPFLMTVLVLVISSMRKNNKNVQPASCGVNYFREER